MRAQCITYFFLLMASSLSFAEDDIGNERDEKLISTFQIVRFPNDVCVGSNSRNGTCYTSAECSDKGGSSSGSCADGFGVCCTFVITTCGSSSSENITYWTAPSTVSSGTCGLTLNSVSDDICSIRLDFTSFVITGPSTISGPEVNRRHGTPIGTMESGLHDFGVGYTTNCLLDQFYSRGASPSSNPPILCGTNTGYHMYLEADNDRGAYLSFHFADAASTADTTTNARGVNTLATRAWDITATQIECTSATLPPPGCTQYYWGAGGSYVLYSYNYQSSTVGTANTHLAQQHQRMCIRRERGKCIGCFFTNDVGLAISGTPEVTAHYTVPGGCCGFDTQESPVWNVIEGFANSGTTLTAASFAFGFDCIIIPGAYTVGNDGGATAEVLAAQTAAALQQHLSANNIFPNPAPPQICGSGGNIGVGAAAGTPLQTAGLAVADIAGTNIEQTICTRVAPFIMEFLSDDLEGQGSAAILDNEVTSATQASNQGFAIHHAQLDC